MNMLPEPVVEKDLPGLAELQPDGWPDIIPEFGFYSRMPFCKAVRVTMEGRLAGVGAGISLGKTAWLAHIIVNPLFRKKGIGRSIVDHLLDWLDHSGCETVSLIATDMGYPLYRKTGFDDQTDYVFLKSEKPLNLPDSTDTIPFTGAAAIDVFSLDKKVSGEDRSGIMMNRMLNAHVLRKNGHITGYFLPGLGEGPIVAEEIETGLAMMELRIPNSKQCVLPVENAAGIDFLKENGFVESKRAKRMVRGKRFSWQPDKIFNRIGGNFG
jgi:GNAT superfamily N-acetyltransferase